MTLNQVRQQPLPPLINTLHSLSDDEIEQCLMESSSDSDKKEINSDVEEII